MRKYLTTALAIALMSGVSYADLQNVEVGGDIRIRGNTYENIYGAKENSTNQWTEQRTEVNVAADFSDEVSAFIAFDSYGEWGTNNSYDDDNSGIGLYEAYIHLGDAVAGFDLKIGRQEVMLGSEFIIGNNSTSGRFDHMSFDGIRADYAGENFNVTLLSLKVEEEDGFDNDEVDDDDDLYSIYATYTGFENHTIDGYVFFERFGDPDDDNAEIFTYGARAAGTFGGGFDYELEIALQDGETGSDLDFKGTAINAELGYTFDSNMQPRVFIGATQFSGSDKGDEYGFYRSYSDWEFSEFLDEGQLTNVLILRAGVSANVTEKISLSAIVSKFEMDEEDDPRGVGPMIYPPFGGEDDIGTEIGLYLNYQYSEDVAVEVGVARFMNGDLLEDLFDDVGTDEGDQTYLYAEISLSF